jgi:hypothetical protein
MEAEVRQRWWESRGEQGLRALLMEHWDPIGVAGVPEARDEYDEYLGPLASKLREGADARAVAEYLAGVERRQMELPASIDQRLGIGELVVDWYASEMERG